jgi:urease accessory protein
MLPSAADGSVLEDSSAVGRVDLSRVGRDGALQLAFERRGDATILTRRLSTLPLQLLEPIQFADGSLCVVPLNPTGGLLGGDTLRTRMDLGPGAHVCVTSPSATKVYRSSGAPTLQDTILYVADRAVLEYVPDHLIPHAGAWLDQSLRVDVAGAGTVILWDAFAAGRLACGERWMFRELTSGIEIRRAGRPLFLDRLELRGSDARLGGPGGFEQLGYNATLVAVAAAFGSWEDLADELQGLLNARGPRVLGGASTLAREGLCARILSATAFELSASLHACWVLLRRRLLGLGPVDLRKN